MPELQDLEQIVDNLYDGVYFVDRQLRITYWNASAERITGYPRERVIHRSYSDNLLVHMTEDGVLLSEDQSPLARTIADGMQREGYVYLHHAEGHRVPVAVRVLPLHSSDGEIIGAAEIFTDSPSTLTAFKQTEELQKAAVLDPLTGVANRRFIEMRLRSLLSELQQHGVSFGLLLIDLDQLKPVNEKFGRETGDKVLKAVAGTLSQNIRTLDLAGRWMADEFVTLILNVTDERLVLVADKLRTLVQLSSLEAGDSVIRMTVSIGATIAQPGDTVETLIDRAYRAMRQGRKQGGNRVTPAD